MDLRSEYRSILFYLGYKILNRAMKIILLIIILAVANSKHHKVHKKHRKNRTPQGPKSMLNQNLPLYRFPFPNEMDKNRDPSLVNLLVVDNQGVIHRNTIERSTLNKPMRFCHVLDPQEFKICENIKDCGTCSRIPKCGWCGQT